VILSIPQLDLLDVANTLEWIFIILFPNYNLGQGLNDIYQNSVLIGLCEPLVQYCGFGPNPCCEGKNFLSIFFFLSLCFSFLSEGNCGDSCVFWTKNYLSMDKPGIGRFVVFMGIQSLISFTILLLIDYRILSKVWYFIKISGQSNSRNLNQSENNTISSIVPIRDTLQIPNITNEDDDVKEEAERIRSSPDHVLMETDVLVLNQVEKVYHGAFHAVDQISVGVKQRECFGLLGVNGA
jgi:ATP-binding cassette subfamily A (ABC1) protein 3